MVEAGNLTGEDQGQRSDEPQDHEQPVQSRRLQDDRDERGGDDAHQGADDGDFAGPTGVAECCLPGDPCRETEREPADEAEHDEQLERGRNGRPEVRDDAEQRADHEDAANRMKEPAADPRRDDEAPELCSRREAGGADRDVVLLGNRREEERSCGEHCRARGDGDQERRWHRWFGRCEEPDRDGHGVAQSPNSRRSSSRPATITLRTRSLRSATSSIVRPSVLIGSSTRTSASAYPRRQSCLRRASRVP